MLLEGISARKALVRLDLPAAGSVGKRFHQSREIVHIRVAVADEQHLQRRLVRLGRCPAGEEKQSEQEEPSTIDHHANTIFRCNSKLEYRLQAEFRLKPGLQPMTTILHHDTRHSARRGLRRPLATASSRSGAVILNTSSHRASSAAVHWHLRRPMAVRAVS